MPNILLTVLTQAVAIVVLGFVVLVIAALAPELIGGRK